MSGFFIAVLVAVVIVGVAAVVLVVARRRGWEPRSGPEMAALPRSSRRIVAKAVERGEQVSDAELAAAAVEHARRVQGSFALLVSRQFVVLSVVVGGLLTIGGSVQIVADLHHRAGGVLPLVLGTWLAGFPLYFRRLNDRTHRAETLNRELAGR